MSKKIKIGSAPDNEYYDPLVRDVEVLLEELKRDTQYWKMSVVLRLVDELAKMEAQLNVQR